MYGLDAIYSQDMDDIMDVPHYHLKTVCIAHFTGYDGQVELAKYILKNALTLEHFILKPSWKYHEGSTTSTVCERYGRMKANKKLAPLDTKGILTIM